MLLRDLNAKFGKEDTFRRTIIGNESLHEAGNDNGITAVNFAVLKCLTRDILLLRYQMALVVDSERHCGSRLATCSSKYSKIRL
jgi:hypothetical protein